MTLIQVNSRGASCESIAQPSVKPLWAALAWQEPQNAAPSALRASARPPSAEAAA